jgi:hypothetical protein
MRLSAEENGKRRIMVMHGSESDEGLVDNKAVEGCCCFGAMTSSDGMYYTLVVPCVPINCTNVYLFAVPTALLQE